MERSTQSLEEMYSKMVLEDEEEGGVVVGAEEIVAKPSTFILVGKFLTEKNINFSAMKNVMAALWRPKEGMEVHELGGFRYSFVFYHVLDLQKVLEGGPWSFEQSMLVCHKLQENEDPHTVPLLEAEVWIQVYDIPKGCISENVLTSIGNTIGRYVKSDPANFHTMWKEYVRIRVAMNIEKPLKRRMKLKRSESSWNWINFKYERMGSFCFVCGVIGHSERECSIVYANPEKTIERAYGVWLRAPNRNVKTGTGARWLRSGNDDGNRWAGNNFGSTSSTNGDGGKTNEPRFMEVDGVMREIAGKQGDVTIVTQNKGDNDGVNQGYNKEGNIVGKDLNLNEIVVIDPKRRRVETELQGERLDKDNMQTDGLDIINGPKNLEGAGTGLQARLAL